MMKLVKVFLWALGISFLGTLPLGTLSITIMQIGLQENIVNALYFSIGAVLVEMIYVRLSLVGIAWIRTHQQIMKLMGWISFFVILAMAIGSFVAAINTHNSTAKNIVLDNNIHRFLLGVIGCSINPIVIVFWFGWSTVLFSKNILYSDKTCYNVYVAAVGLGAFIAYCGFIFLGKFIVQHIANSQHYLNWSIAIVFSISALVQLWKLYKNKPLDVDQ